MATGTTTTLQFLGAAGTVTGSRYLIESAGQRTLVDCGLFQGYKQLRERNRAEFPVPPATIDTVLLTHAHLDHSGYLPALVRNGFRGRILCTPATRDLCALLLPDSAHLLEDEARYARKKGYSKHADPTPLYTIEDAESSLQRMATRDFDEDLEVAPGIRARFHHAGHLLGAAQTSVDIAGTIVHFSGDLGRAHDPLMRPPQPLQQADVLVCESTYGNRRHARVDAEAELAPVIRRVAHMGECFCRMREFYLQACAACFRHGHLAVFQRQLARTLDRLPVTRDYLYPAATVRPAATPRRISQRRATA